MNTLDEDLQGLAREKERLEREAQGQQVEVVALGPDGEPSSRGQQRTLSVDERKARESEAHELEVALHVKRNERERKRRELEGRFASVFSDVESRREALRRVEDGVQDMEATRQRKVCPPAAPGMSLSLTQDRLACPCPGARVPAPAAQPHGAAGGAEGGAGLAAGQRRGAGAGDITERCGSGGHREW